MSKAYCMKCGKELTDIEKLKECEECECGSKSTIYGTTVVKTANGFGCSCGSDKLRMIGHMNMNPIYIKEYQCLGCGAVITTKTYYKSPYL